MLFSVNTALAMEIAIDTAIAYLRGSEPGDAVAVLLAGARLIAGEVPTHGYLAGEISVSPMPRAGVRVHPGRYYIGDSAGYGHTRAKLLALTHLLCEYSTMEPPLTIAMRTPLVRALGGRSVRPHDQPWIIYTRMSSLAATIRTAYPPHPPSDLVIALATASALVAVEVDGFPEATQSFFLNIRHRMVQMGIDRANHPAILQRVTGIGGVQAVRAPAHR